MDPCKVHIGGVGVQTPSRSLHARSIDPLVRLQRHAALRAAWPTEISCRDHHHVCRRRLLPVELLADLNWRSTTFVLWLSGFVHSTKSLLLINHRSRRGVSAGTIKQCGRIHRVKSSVFHSVRENNNENCGCFITTSIITVFCVPTTQYYLFDFFFSRQSTTNCRALLFVFFPLRYTRSDVARETQQTNKKGYSTTNPKKKL